VSMSASLLTLPQGQKGPDDLWRFPSLQHPQPVLQRGRRSSRVEPNQLHVSSSLLAVQVSPSPSSSRSGRLSPFLPTISYNTTPTAAYTYAPAYKHYGPKIHAVHFIGAQKPWSSLSYRSARPPPSGSLPYDYNSLIDRWFGVYDKFVRPTYALRSFEVPRTVAAWEGGSTGGRLGLEELKKIAEEGWWRGTGPNGAPEGAYMALPRDGRIDLMRRNPEAEPIPSPSSPPPLPSQQERSAPSPVIQSPEPVRPHDQYLTNWDPARSSPPRGSGPEHHQMREPMDARYENVWDLQETRAQKENDRRWREGGGGRQIWDVPSEMRDGR
jgi:hypothetical protein